MTTPAPNLHVTLIGGPTLLIEVPGFRFLTDPTFDPGGSEYTTSVYTLRKTTGPAISSDSIGEVDAVLLSHDHHFDNLDRTGRQFLARARRVLTTHAGAERLGGNAIGLAPWESIDVDGANGSKLRITGTPARHGPPDGDRGPVIGFLISAAGDPVGASTPALYVSGDTVWYDGLRPIADRADVRAAVLFIGAARVVEVGLAHLTFHTEDAVEAAKFFSRALIVPVHYEGWEHFSQGRADFTRAFDAAGLSHRIQWLEPGQPTTLG